MISKTYPVLVLCGSDRKRRRLLRELDPEGKYPSKALLPFLGKRVIDWQIEALRASPYIGNLYLLGLSVEEILLQPPVYSIPVDPTSGIEEKLLTGVHYLESEGEDTNPLIVTTADTPGMTTASINSFFEQLEAMPGDPDGVLTGVPIEPTLEIFPSNNRVVAYFRDHHIYPGELAALKGQAIQKAQALIEDIGTLRRSFNRSTENVSLGPALRYIARKPGLWPMILRYLLGSLSLARAERELSRAFQLDLRVIVIPDPGFGMDMDMPEDFQLLEAYVRKVKLQGDVNENY
mgnify:CR=1 FL=1